MARKKKSKTNNVESNNSKKMIFNVELQILRLGRNESVQMQPVEAETLEEAR